VTKGAEPNAGPDFTMVSGTGNCLVQYGQYGNGTYRAAARVSNVVAVDKKAATLTLGNLNQLWDGNPKPGPSSRIRPG